MPFCANVMSPPLPVLAAEQRHAWRRRIGEYRAAAAADGLQEHAMRAQAGRQHVAGVLHAERAAIAAGAVAAAQRHAQSVDAEHVGDAATRAHALEDHADRVVARGLDVAVERRGSRRRPTARCRPNYRRSGWARAAPALWLPAPCSSAPPASVFRGAPPSRPPCPRHRPRARSKRRRRRRRSGTRRRAPMRRA